MSAAVLENSAQRHLAQVARCGLAHVDFDTVRDVALDVWYGASFGSTDLTKLDGPHKGDALFLVERLAYYNVVPQVRKSELLDGVRAAGGSLNAVKNLALERLFRGFLPELQPLQTRHFKPLHWH